MNLFNKRKWLALSLSVFVLVSAVYLAVCTGNTSASAVPSDDKKLVINALGDSITYGSGTENSSNVYANQVAKSLGADKVNNYGLPSSPISNTVNLALSAEENEKLSFLDRAKDMDRDADIIFVFGGVNDYSLNVPLGHKNDRSPETFSGSLNTLFRELERNYPKSSIIALTPLKRYDQVGVNAAGHHLEDYANRINTIADKYDQVHTIDLFHADSLDFTQGSDIELLVDGLHPSDEGQTRIARYIMASLGTVGILSPPRKDWLMNQTIIG